MSAEMRRQKRPATWFLDGLVWLLLMLLLIPTAVAMESLAWARTVQPWVIPGVLVAGLAIGAVLALVSAPQRWWWALLVAAALLGAAITAGALLAQHGARAADNAVGEALFGAYTAALSACLPWLAFRTKQTWLGVVLVWVTVAGAWNKNLTAQQVWWMLWLIALSLLLIGVTHLRDETRLWQTFGLERLGPVFWPSARVILSISLLIAVTGLIPLGITRFGALSQALRHTPLSQNGALDLNTADGTPVAMLGAPLSLSAPDVSSDQVILTYTLTSGPPVAPPILGTAFDTFDGATWTHGPGLSTISPAEPLTTPPGAQVIQARITLVNAPRSDAATPLLSFDQPLSFSVSAQAQVIGEATGSPDLVNVAGWVSPSSLARGATYTTTSAMLPSDAVGTGSLTADLMARLTATPPALTPTLAALAREWAGAGTPAQQAQALIDKMQSVFTLDPKATPPAHDAITWFLRNKSGNVLLWTATYILLGRSIGLPLRLAEGYLSGNYDPATHRQVVRASDAAVWAQLAIPQMGWLDLFPAAQALTITEPSRIIYTGRPTPTPGTAPTPRPTQTHDQQAQRSPSTPSGLRSDTGIPVALLAALILLALALALLGVLSLRWSRFGRHLGPLTQFFARVALLARLAGVALRPSDTATQATTKVVHYIPEHADALVSMNSVYERFRYGAPENRGILPNLRSQWRALRGALYRLVVTRPWRRHRLPARP